MGTASAKPANLYTYSDRCSRAEDALRQWVRGVLNPAMTEFFQGAAHGDDGTNVDLDPVLNRAGTVIGQELPNQLTAAWRTDHEVRQVGLAFQLAGGHGALEPPPTQPVHSDDGRIGTLLSGYAAGVAAAPQLRFAPVSPDSDTVSPRAWDNPIFDLLEKHADDPEFCQGLLAAGGPQAVRALLTALASGQFHYNLMNPGNGHVVTGTSATDILTKIFKNALADPNLAAQLGPSLPTIIPQVLQEAQPRYRALRAWHDMLPVITAIMSELRDPAVALKLTTAIGQAVPKDFTAGDLKGLMPEFTAMMSAGIAHSVPPIRPGETWAAWAKRYGADTQHALAPFLAAMKAADLSQNEQNELLRSMFQGAYLNVAMLPLGGDTVVTSAALGALQSWIGAKDPTNTMGLGAVLRDTNPDHDIVTINNLIDVKAGHYALIASLLAQHKIPDPDHPGGPALSLTGGPGDSDLVRRIAADPGKYHIVGDHGDQRTQLDVGQLLDEYNNGAGYLDPKSEIYKLLTAE